MTFMEELNALSTEVREMMGEVSVEEIVSNAMLCDAFRRVSVLLDAALAGNLKKWRSGCHVGGT